MFKGLRKDPFVCLDDITGKVEPHNYVIYNPDIDPVEVRQEKLCRIINEAYGIQLSIPQVTQLTSYGVDDLPLFVKELKQIIRHERKK